jgi:pimeloyl-ACP methyl ester carboxylesterase
MMQLETQHRVERIIVVAHSMGGLVARGFLLRHAQRSRTEVPLFATLSTPWAGHQAAGMGVKHAPVVVDVWRDMAPGSSYLNSLFAQPLSPETQHHLLFTFARNSASFGVSSDRTVSVSSQLFPTAQQQAVRVYGVDTTHTGVLDEAQVANWLNGLLRSIH